MDDVPTKQGSAKGVVETGKATDAVDRAEPIKKSCPHVNENENEVTKLTLKHDAPRLRSVDADVCRGCEGKAVCTVGDDM